MAKRFQRFLDTLIFHSLLAIVIGFLGLCSILYTWESDWTANGRNSLSDVSTEVLDKLDEPVRITSFIPDNPELRQRVEDLLDRYRRYRPDLVEFVFVNPFEQPDQVRELGITLAGELLLEYGGRQETLQRLSEESITNAIQRLAQEEYWIAALSGHGERRLAGEANHDLGSFGAQLTSKGFRLQSLNLAEVPSVPVNTDLLIIASPLVDLLPGETGLVRDYIARGGNLLLLLEPEKIAGLEPLATSLGIRMLPGVIVDAGAGDFGINNPAVAVVPRYTAHAATADFDLLSLYPRAAAFTYKKGKGWDVQPLLTTLSRSWNETGPIEGQIERNPDQGEVEGPLAVGLVLTRDREGGEGGGVIQQRILIVGDGDFLSNAYVNNAGNLDLGLRLVRWLAGETRMLEIPATTMRDTNFTLSDTLRATLGLGFLLGLPLLFLGAGGIIWWRRRGG